MRRARRLGAIAGDLVARPAQPLVVDGADLRRVDVRAHGHARVGAQLRDYRIVACTEGQAALGGVSDVLEVEGATGAGKAGPPAITDEGGRAAARALSEAVARAGAGEPIGLPEAGGG